MALSLSPTLPRDGRVSASTEEWVTVRGELALSRQPDVSTIMTHPIMTLVMTHPLVVTHPVS
jgi:hypothetical protein